MPLHCRYSSSSRIMGRCIWALCATDQQIHSWRCHGPDLFRLCVGTDHDGPSIYRSLLLEYFEVFGIRDDRRLLSPLEVFQKFWYIFTVAIVTFGKAFEPSSGILICRLDIFVQIFSDDFWVAVMSSSAGVCGCSCLYLQMTTVIPRDVVTAGCICYLYRCNTTMSDVIMPFLLGFGYPSTAYGAASPCTEEAARSLLFVDVHYMSPEVCAGLWTEWTFFHGSSHDN